MKCPNDNTEMEQGVLSVQGSRWLPQKKVNTFWGGFFVTGAYQKVVAWKCPKCGEIKLVASK